MYIFPRHVSMIPYVNVIDFDVGNFFLRYLIVQRINIHYLRLTNNSLTVINNVYVIRDDVATCSYGSH